MNAVTLSLVLTLSAAAFAPQRMGSQPLDPPREERVQRLGKKLRCAVCQGLAITDSPASMARAQLDKVRELVSEGKSDEEINAYFVARYGEWVLLQPTAEGLNLLVWALPAVLLGVGVVVILAQVKKKGRALPESAVTAEPAADEEEYLRQVRAELDR